MRSRGISRVLCCAVLVTGVILSNKPSFGANCALYVRAETGVALYGAAGGWWNEAEGRYARGQAPAVGAILVFRRTGHMRSGHVALVTKVVSTHEILVDHANWYHGTVNRGTSVIDTSSNHDWTTVAVMELRSGKHGRDNPTFGFIYPQAGLRDIVDSPVSPAGLFIWPLPTQHIGRASAERGLDACRDRSPHRLTSSSCSSADVRSQPD